jgi:PDZ domain
MSPCLTFFALRTGASAQSTGSSAISEPANAPGSTLTPAVPAAAGASVPSSLTPSTTRTPTSAAASSSAGPGEPSWATNSSSANPVTANPLPVAGAGGSSAALAPRTLTLPAGTVTVPPITGQTETLDPNDPAAAGFDSNSDIANYERFQNPDAYQPQIPVQQLMNEEDDVVQPLGIEVREDHRKLKSGEDTTGLLITSVASGSPASKAGLHAHTDTARNVLEGAAVAGALVFPPAVLLAPIIASVPLGESYDLIIAVDGWRVMNVMEFEDRLRDVQPGEIVYLSVIRDGSRLQVPLKVPANLAAASPG